MRSVTANFLGDNLLVLGDPRFKMAVADSPIINKFLAHCKGTMRQEPDCYSRYDKLSFESESMHLIYAAHVLGGLRNPHETLREMARVLAPEGVIVVAGFNPLSSWGIRKSCTWFKKQNPWEHEFLTQYRVVDWLKLLGFEILDLQHLFYRLPINNQVVLDKTKFLEAWKFLPPGVHVVVARKHVTPITPVMRASRISKILAEARDNAGALAQS